MKYTEDSYVGQPAINLIQTSLHSMAEAIDLAIEELSNIEPFNSEPQSEGKHSMNFSVTFKY